MVNLHFTGEDFDDADREYYWEVRPRPTESSPEPDGLEKTVVGLPYKQEGMIRVKAPNRYIPRRRGCFNMEDHEFLHHPHGVSTHDTCVHCGKMFKDCYK